MWTVEHQDVGDTLSVDLEYMGPQSGGWQEIASGIENMGSHTWHVSELEKADNYRLRITVTDETGLTAADSCNTPFAIWEKVFITDANLKEWDITHAVRVYDMDPENFIYGLGTDAIRPLENPPMLSPGDPGYPEDTLLALVVGVNVSGDVRAYPLLALAGHEAINDVVGGADLTVVY
jgi:hypothetical protein